MQKSIINDIMDILCLTDEGAVTDENHDCWDDESGHVGHDIE